MKFLYTFFFYQSTVLSKIINNSAGDCSISLKFRTDVDHMTFDVPRTFKVNKSKVKVTVWHSVRFQKTL